MAVLFAGVLVAVSGAASHSWENPTGSEIYSGETITLNVSAPNSSSIDFYYDTGSATLISQEGSPSSGDYYTTSWDTNNAGTGDIDLIADNGTTNETVSVQADFNKPSISDESPTGDVSDSGPEVSYSASDDISGVNSSTYYIRVEDSDNNLEEEANSSSVSTSDLNNGDTYEVSYRVSDQRGNWNNETDAWSFTVDTSYDGESDPALDWSNSPDDGIIDMEDDVTLTAGFDTDSDEVPSEMRCYRDYEDEDDKGDEIDEDTSGDTDDGEEEFDCDFDQDDYGGDTVDVTLEFCDEAGNCETSSVGEIVFDDSDPVMDQPELSEPLETVNGDFEVNFDATDESGIEELEYFFDETTMEGDGYSVNVDGDDSFTVNESNIPESGSQTLFVRVRDATGKWSPVREIGFEYLPNAEPEITLTAPSSVQVQAGTTETLEVMIENTGELHVESTTVQASGEGVSGSERIVDLVPGDSMNVSFDVSPGEKALGPSEITVNSSSPEASTTVQLDISASDPQRSSIESTLENYRSKLQSLESNISALNSDGLSGKPRRRVEGNLSRFRSSVENASSAAESGNYYRAQQELEGIESEYSSAESSYDSARQVHEQGKRTAYALWGITGLLIVLGGAGAFFYSSEEHGFDLEEIDSETAGGIWNTITKKIDQLKSGGEKEAEDFEWNGFQ